jgi:hypothetical protein
MANVRQDAASLVIRHWTLIRHSDIRHSGFLDQLFAIGFAQ